MDQPKKECNIHHQGNDIYWMGKLQPVTRLETGKSIQILSFFWLML